MLAEDKENMFIDSDIKWRMIKIHPGFEFGFWQKEVSVMNYVVDIAMDIKVPIMIHTENSLGCYSTDFAEILERHPNQIFVLAHGRPINNAIQILKEYQNAYVDTSFMPAEDIKKWCH